MDTRLEFFWSRVGVSTDLVTLMFEAFVPYQNLSRANRGASTRKGEILMPEVSSVSEVLLIFATIGLGWWHTLPGFGVSDELMVESERLEKRQRTELGSLARRPLLLSYMDNSLLHWRNFLLPIGLNLGIWFGIGWTNPWFWIGMITVEAIAIFSIQGYRRYRFSRDIHLFMRRTDPGNRTFVGYIIIQEVGSDDEFGAANQGRMITAKKTDGDRWVLFVCVPYDEEYDVRSYRPSELVRIFYEPLSLAMRRYFPDEVDGVVIGIEPYAPAQQSVGSDDESLELGRWSAERADS